MVVRTSWLPIKGSELWALTTPVGVLPFGVVVVPGPASSPGEPLSVVAGSESWTGPVYSFPGVSVGGGWAFGVVFVGFGSSFGGGGG